MLAHVFKRAKADLQYDALRGNTNLRNCLNTLHTLRSDTSSRRFFSGGSRGGWGAMEPPFSHYYIYSICGKARGVFIFMLFQERSTFTNKTL